MKKRILSHLFLNNNRSHLVLHVTNRCNLRCKTCFLDFENDKGSELTLEEIDGISEDVGKLIWLDISGGEPFLRKDIPDICAKFDTKLISIPTNGFDPTLIYETTKEIISKTNAQINIAISLDGFEKTNAIIRSEDSFKKAIKTLELLKTIRSISVKVNTVLCEKNYDEIIDFMKFIKQYNIEFHSIIFQRGGARFPDYECPSYDKLLKIKNDIFNIWETYNYGFKTIEGKILANYHKCMYETSLKIIKERRQVPPCLAGKRHLVIYANGDISFCETLAPFGNIREGDIGTVLSSTAAREQREFIQERKCYCHHNCNILDNFFLNPLQYPKLLTGSIRWPR